MDLALSLGDPSQSVCGREKSPNKPQDHNDFSGVLSDGDDGRPLQLDLLPFAPVLPSPSFPSYASSHQFLAANSAQPASESRAPRAFDVNRSPEVEMHVAMSNEGEPDRTSSRGSDDDDESYVARRKLRLSREQSAFLEESFNEHHSLNPTQKSALAKQLNLRPRQVEVWFQNRRARTKLKQTEVDCEYLRSVCEALAQENRRMQKEVHELRALKSAQPFYSRFPATTLTICPSCERSPSIAAGSSFTTNNSLAGNTGASSIGTGTHGVHHAASSQKRSNIQSQYGMFPLKQ